MPSNRPQLAVRPSSISIAASPVLVIAAELSISEHYIANRIISGLERVFGTCRRFLDYITLPRPLYQSFQTLPPEYHILIFDLDKCLHGNMPSDLLSVQLHPVLLEENGVPLAPERDIYSCWPT